jgi:putative toxin-antitoxin system antitoxin component (TIGR02293 family)
MGAFSAVCPDRSANGIWHKNHAKWQKMLAPMRDYRQVCAMKNRKPKRPEEATYPEIRDNAAMALRVEEGLPVADVMEFGRAAGFGTDELARLIHIPPRTYARRVASGARLKIPEGERAARLMRLYDRAKELFGTHENTRSWLNTEIPALGGRTPLDFAQTEPGAREVEAVIERIEDGVVM